GGAAEIVTHLRGDVGDIWGARMCRGRILEILGVLGLILIKILEMLTILVRELELVRDEDGDDVDIDRVKGDVTEIEVERMMEIMMRSRSLRASHLLRSSCL
ncbi:hypothetical protein Dimus_011082, partial [Dionaea muscipula]